MDSQIERVLILITFLIPYSQSSEDQNSINELFDTFLERYSNYTLNLTNLDGGLSVSTSACFIKSDKILNGNQVVNETSFYGLNELTRRGDIVSKQIGLQLYNVSGRVTLPAPKIDGSIYFTNTNILIGKANYYAISMYDVDYDFIAIVNFDWNQIAFQSFEFYNFNPWTFPITMNCTETLQTECKLIESDMVMAVKKISLDIPLISEYLLSTTPLK